MGDNSPSDKARAGVERARAGMARARSWIARNSYIAVAAAAVLVLTRTVEFKPPEFVRASAEDDSVELVGEFPRQDFTDRLANPQTVQMRATLRRYKDPALRAEGPDEDLDDQGEVISQPVVTTILGVKATIDQTVRIGGGRLAVNLSVVATPRLEEVPRGRTREARLTLEHTVKVRSRRSEGWRGEEVGRVHLQTRGTWIDVDDRRQRLLFAVDDHLFSLDLELRRG